MTATSPRKRALCPKPQPKSSANSSAAQILNYAQSAARDALRVGALFSRLAPGPQGHARKSEVSHKARPFVHKWRAISHNPLSAGSAAATFIIRGISLEAPTATGVAVPRSTSRACGGLRSGFSANNQATAAAAVAAEKDVPDTLWWRVRAHLRPATRNSLALQP